MSNILNNIPSKWIFIDSHRVRSSELSVLVLRSGPSFSSQSVAFIVLVSGAHTGCQRKRML